MRIVVNDIAASCSGALTILRQFYAYVRKNCPGDEWIFLLGDTYVEETDNIRVLVFPEVKRSRIRKVWFDCFAGRRVVNALKPDAVLSLQNIITFGAQAPQAVYVHQSIPFQEIRDFSFFKHEERAVAVIQKIIGQFIIASVRRAETVIVQTSWMREAVAAKTGVPLEKIFVARPDIERLPAMDKPTSFSPRRFFYPTADSIYKNNDLILEACQLLNQQGITDFQVVLTLPPGRYSHPNIICCGYLDKEALCAHYLQAVLLFPSYIETIGLPLLEGRALGVPIIAADCPFSKDGLAKYPNASFFPPFDAAALAARMQEAMNLPARRITSDVIDDTSTEWGRVVRALRHP